ncbi:hypothetical protein ANN_17309 [Periplaneta americana]|uniref:Uncharacterized protein n=1 Tax=Periplaneta americana TaxID=6978 RepID=A0ABQ8SSK6_PERAM|nr:hypothetical protein ANN_17309 [Periplaneta americana]
MLAGNEFQSLGKAIVKEDEYEEVRWDGIVSIVSWRERVFRLWWEESMESATRCYTAMPRLSYHLVLVSTFDPILSLRLKGNVKTAEKADVDCLLKQRFGDKWRNMPKLHFYANIVDYQKNDIE